MAPTSGRRKSSATKKKTVNKRGKGRQPGQGASVMMNNFFPALNEIQPQGGMTSEELAAMQLQQAMIQNNQEGEEYAQDNMQLINEVPLEEEEGESQDVTQSRKLHSQQHH
jgi:hypothetical protein